MRLDRRTLFLCTVGAVLTAYDTTAREVPFFGKVGLESDLAGATSVVSADLDGDADLDLLAPTSNGIIWWENEGQGGLWDEHPLDTAVAGAGAVAAADVDHDGDLDVIGSSSLDDQVLWWENTAGDGSTWIRRPIATAFAGAGAVVMADLDRDGDLDVLSAASVADDVVWWENLLGAPAWPSVLWPRHDVDLDFDSPISVSAADVDGDGDLDIVAGTSNVGGVNWWENTAGNGSAWFERVIIGVGGGVTVTGADMDRDGDADVLVAMLNGGIRWWQNTAGNGTAWASRVVSTTFAVSSAVPVDLDADGDLDVLSTGRTVGVTAGEVRWWENTAGDATAWTSRPMDEDYRQARAAHAADLDGDGDLDVLAASTYGDAGHPDIIRYVNATIHRSAVFPARSPIGAGPFAGYSVMPADLDGDGDEDALAVQSSSVTWWDNAAGDGTVWTPQTIDSSGTTVAAFAVDVDRDGDLDVLGAEYDIHRVSWWENTVGDGSEWVRATVAESLLTPVSVWAADLDQDGDPDVLATGFEHDRVVWWRNTAGDGSAWALQTLSTTLDGAYAVTAADMDGDSDPDVLVAAPPASTIAWFENELGDATAWSVHTVDATFAYPRAVALADVDGDGDRDVLGTSFGSAEVAWWENAAGDASVWARHTLGTLSAAGAVRAADLDGDGDRDVLAAGGGAGDVVWWENDRSACGVSCSWPQRTVDADFPLAADIAVADVDRDGDLDVFGATLGQVAWWSNRGGQFALPTADTAPPTLANGQAAALFRIDALHRGRPPDVDVELSTFALRFEEAAGDPLSAAEAVGLVRRLGVYLDDGSGAFDPADALVASVDSLALDAAGVQIVAFADDDPRVVVRHAFHAPPRAYHVVVEMTASASLQTPSRFRLTHLTESSSTAEHWNFDIPVAIEYGANVASGIVVAVAAADLIFADGFE
jgi:hypothetical protein